ncbi:hypothetical protein LCGC14_0319870 [marine sediment metagenome]|uniref:Uncharacterized protein n=1 Tax=marine sediment metagenome TaxID=412755 RepID=A0A0F9TPY9_9ZZZZ
MTNAEELNEILADLEHDSGPLTTEERKAVTDGVKAAQDEKARDLAGQIPGWQERYDKRLARAIGERALAQVAREELAQVEAIRARRNNHKWLRKDEQAPDGNDGHWSCEDDIQTLLNCLDRALAELKDQL